MILQVNEVAFLSLLTNQTFLIALSITINLFTMINLIKIMASENRFD